MATIIKQIKDKLGNIILPITREKCVYDKDNVRLDNKLNEMKYESLVEFILGIDIVSYANSITKSNVRKVVRIMNGLYVPPGYETNSNDFIYIINTIHTNPEDRWWKIKAFDVRSNREFSLISSASAVGSWFENLDVSKIVQTDTVNDTTKVPSSAVTYGLGQEIDNLFNTKAERGELPYGTDLNALSGSGMYTVLSPANAPYQEEWFAIQYIDNGHFGVMYAMTPSGAMFFRIKAAGIWSGTWSQMNWS